MCMNAFCSGNSNAQGGTSEGNQLTIYNSGTSAFTEMWTAIKKAKHRIDLETYILKPDTVGLQMLSCLTDAAKRGCKYVPSSNLLFLRKITLCSVTVLYDALGSLDINEEVLAPLKEAGGRA